MFYDQLSYKSCNVAIIFRMNSSRSAEKSKIDNPVQASQEVLNSETTESEKDAEFWPLSGKPYASVLLAKSHLHPLYSLVITSFMW